MFAYCNNNPVMYCDPDGDVGILGILAIGIIIGLTVSIPSSEKIEISEQQQEAAREAADQATFSVRKDEFENPYTIDIAINPEDVVDSIDDSSLDYGVTMDYYYECLYNKSVEIANEFDVPLDNLMSPFHIMWEFEVHLQGWYLGIENCNEINLNVEETLLTMFWRFVEGVR